MNKYKVNYKANDKDPRQEIIDKIKTFYINFQPIKEIGFSSNTLLPANRGLFTVYGEVTRVDLNTGATKPEPIFIEVNFHNMTVYKTRKQTISMKFRSEELKLFDTLGFDLTARHKSATRQCIEDWFGRVE